MSLLTHPPIADIRRSLRERAISAEELVRDVIDSRSNRTPDSHGTLGSTHLINDQRALDQASSATSRLAVSEPDDCWLCGIPMTVKSVFGVTGYPCYAGCASPLPPEWSRDGVIVEGLREQGVPITGVTHAAELSVGGLGVNAHYSTPRNPWDNNEHRVPGGSSAGAAISLWEGAALFALGTDTGGSVRVPASAAGLVGFKPSNGFWPVDGVVPLASGYDTIGYVTRTIADAREVFIGMQQAGRVPDVDFSSLVSDYRQGASPRLTDFNFKRVSQVAWRGLDPGIGEAVDVALDSLCAAGMPLGADEHGLFDRAATIRDEGPNTAAFECRAMVLNQFPDLWDQLSSHVKEFLNTAIDMDAAAVEARLHQVSRWRDQANEVLNGNDILLGPTLKLTPPTLEKISDPESFGFYSDGLLHNTVLASMNGFCALTLPVGLDSAGLPVGLQLCAKRGAEWNLLKAAQAIEATLGSVIDLLGTPSMVGSPDKL